MTSADGVTPEDLFTTPHVRKDIADLVVMGPKSGAWIWDLATNRIDWSPSVYPIFNVIEFDHTLECFQRLIHPDDLRAGTDEIMRAVSSGTIFQTSFRVLREGQTTRLIQNIGRAQYDYKGAPVRIIGTVSDITNLQKPEKHIGTAHQTPVDHHSVDHLRAIRDSLRLQLSASTESAGAGGDQDILELLLARIETSDMAANLADKLLRQFNSLSEVIFAPQAMLRSVEGIGDAHIVLFDVIQLSIQALLRPLSARARFESETSIVNYLRAAQAYQPKEQFRVIFLDKSAHIISNEVMQEGTVDHTPVYIREIIKRALDLSASSLVLVHNHPSGDPKPSRFDIDMTKAIITTAKGLGISVADHIILAKNGHTSMKNLGLLD